MNVLLDARYGMRQLRRAPLTTAVAVLTLAVGIGMNTAVFSLIETVLLRPLSYPAAERLVWIAPHNDHFRQDTWASRADYREWKQQTHAFDTMTAYGNQDLTIVADGEASQERVASIEGDFWTIVGARPQLGRLFAAGDERAIVLSYGLFERRFGGRAAVVGRTVSVNGSPFTIAGVLPRDFRLTFPQQLAPGDERRGVDAYIPLPNARETPGQPIAQTRGPAPPWVSVVARLRDGVPIDRARAEMETVHRRLQRDYPRPPMLMRSIRVVPLADKLVEHARLSLLVLCGAVGFVLLIAATNVANLLLAQAAGRTRETAIRAAIGAGRARLTAQCLVESVILALIGGAAGVFLAYVAVPAIVRMNPAPIPRLGEATIDGPVLLFSLLISIGTGVLFACAPIVEISRVSLLSALSDATHSSPRREARVQGILISLEVALALVLVTGAGLMMKSLWRMHAYPPGFAPESTYVMRIPLSGPRYERFDQKIVYVDELLKRLSATPGVDAAGISASTYNLAITVQDGREFAPGARPMVAVRMVSPAYLRAMGAPLVAGRWPNPEEALDAVVVNETFARVMMPTGDPVGRAIGGAFVSGTIVGVVADFPYARLDGAAMPEIYYPYQRSPVTRSIVVVVRMSEAAVAAVRRLVAVVDPTQPVYEFRSLAESLADSVAPRRFNLFLLAIFAASALVMALAGTFGVVARAVTRRTRETGIRIALGAQRSDVVGMLIRQAMTYVLAGIVAGIGAAAALGPAMRSMLYAVEPHDPATIASVAGVLALAALTACCLPALRAARVDPVVALRYE